MPPFSPPLRPQVLSNDELRAPLHRVLAPHGASPRYSAAFFFNPAASAVVAPLPRFVSPGRPAAYAPINWGEFRARRAAGDMEDEGEEVQISQYRTAAAPPAAEQLP